MLKGGSNVMYTFTIWAIVQYLRKHHKILATIFLLLPTVINSRVSHYSGHSHYPPILNLKKFPFLPFKYIDHDNLSNLVAKINENLDIEKRKF